MVLLLPRTRGSAGDTCCALPFAILCLGNLPQSILWLQCAEALADVGVRKPIYHPSQVPRAGQDHTELNPLVGGRALWLLKALE